MQHPVWHQLSSYLSSLQLQLLGTLLDELLLLLQLLLQLLDLLLCRTQCCLYLIDGLLLS